MIISYQNMIEIIGIVSMFAKDIARLLTRPVNGPFSGNVIRSFSGTDVASCRLITHGHMRKWWPYAAWRWPLPAMILNQNRILVGQRQWIKHACITYAFTYLGWIVEVPWMVPRARLEAKYHGSHYIRPTRTESFTGSNIIIFFFIISNIFIIIIYNSSFACNP